MRRRLLSGAATFAAAAGLFVLAPSSPAQAAICPASLSANTAGGEAAWTVTCYGGNVYVDGWVKDTAEDGKCARVKSLIAGTWHYSAAACPSGTRKTFSWSGSGTNADTYLYVS